ncbi:MAG TPA: DUF6527 family protein [Gemmataceae bacterium]|nr:DUF6527 family protein [Gemmataceae bacterium]
MKWLRTLWDWLVGLFRGPATKPAPEQTPPTVFTAEIPESPAPDVFYLIGEGEYLWFVVFLCPCGCGETVQLNLLPDERPRWEVTAHEDGTISVEPSVRRVRGCRSHFFVRRGCIDWCGPKPVAPDRHGNPGNRSGSA